MSPRSPKRSAAERVRAISIDAIEGSTHYGGAVSNAITAAIEKDRALRHYRQFMEMGDLVFDLGANVGERTAVFRELGARVVAIDPQPSCVEALEARFADDPAVTVVGEAVAAKPGTYPMRIDENHTLSTMSDEWIEAVRQSGRFEADWGGMIEVPGTTMDALIDRFGLPVFCKIDVEGYESEVVGGLSRTLPAASVEFAGEALEGPLACIEKFSGLGPCEFALVYGETMMLGPWRSAEEVVERLRSLAGDLEAWGNLYMRAAG